MNPQLLSILQDAVKTKLNLSFADNLVFVKARGCQSYGPNKILFFSLVDGRPIAVVKFGKGDSAALVEAEARKLNMVINALGPESLAGAVPRILGIVSEADYCLSIETWAGVENREKMSKKNITQALSWITEAQLLFAKNLIPVTTRLELEQKIARYRTPQSALWENEEFCDYLKKNIAELAAIMPTMLSIPQHGDYHYDNVLLQNGQIFVIDWSRYDNVHLPLFDQIFFLLRIKTPDKSLAHLTILKSQAEKLSVPEKAFPSLIRLTEIFTLLERLATGNFVYTSDTVNKLIASSDAVSSL